MCRCCALVTSNAPSNVKPGYRVPTAAPTVTSLDTLDGPLVFTHKDDVADVHAAVVQALLSTRTLGVASDIPKLSPLTVTLPSSVRALLSTPR